MQNLYTQLEALRSQLFLIQQQHQANTLLINQLEERISKLSAQIRNAEDTSILSKEAQPRPVPEMRNSMNPSISTIKNDSNFPIEPTVNVDLNLKRKNIRHKSDWERLIGENLINKIGIIITILGVAIGAKYAIDHELISPLTRIVLGYLLGLGFLGVAWKLKQSYHNFSAVLLSGGMTILYFITYAAYDYYSLLPQWLAFILMVLFTTFTTVAAMQYNKMLIAVIGLIGAYSIPFLLSTGEGNVVVLLSYVAIINVGILFLSFKRQWSILYYLAFVITWAIYGSWIIAGYDLEDDFYSAIGFLNLYFVTFYAAFLANKIYKKHSLQLVDVIMLLLNAFIFFGIGYYLMSEHTVWQNYLGVFALFNAVLHFIASYLVYKRQAIHKQVYYLLAAMVLTFVTITIPIQLEGSWVTLFWIVEAALLFWIGRKKGYSIFELLSYPMIALSTLSLLHDWNTVLMNISSDFKPILNVNFLIEVIFLICLIVIIKWNNDKQHATALYNYPYLQKFIGFTLPCLLIFILYFTGRIELEMYWESKVQLTARVAYHEYSDTSYNQYNYNLYDLKTFWVINYSLLFASCLLWYSVKKLKQVFIVRLSSIILCLCMLTFLIQGLFVISELRKVYLYPDTMEHFVIPTYYLYLRYVGYFFALLGMLSFIYLYKSGAFTERWQKVIYLSMHIFILWVASSEMIHWLDIYRPTASYKLGLSILWGVYALGMIVLGILKKNQLVRMGAFALMAITLMKLFFYDIAHLDTIDKTIVMVSLGILLLIISFLYNKYKHLISNESNA